MKYYIDAFKKYAVFSGRATRTEFWMFYLINGIILFLLSLALVVHFLYLIYTVVMIIPGLAVWIRRLHDAGRSGWWWLIIFLPFLGFIASIVFLTEKSQPGENKYGPNPRGL